jgi:hypothetical protein
VAMALTTGKHVTENWGWAKVLRNCEFLRLATELISQLRVRLGNVVCISWVLEQQRCVLNHLCAIIENYTTIAWSPQIR